MFGGNKPRANRVQQDFHVRAPGVKVAGCDKSEISGGSNGFFSVCRGHYSVLEFPLIAQALPLP